MIFVFGSNLSGIHGAGAALYAQKYEGAVYGIGEGLQGNSYALPTKGINISYMPLDIIAQHVDAFKQFAELNPKLNFKVTRVATGLAGFYDEEIAPLFIGSPKNCFFDLKWKKWLPDYEYWGTL